jgi:A/G-specific adenine glycosylase
MLNSFTNKLLNWHLTKNTRVMPWKEEKDPYKIWFSEIILQQTRVEQGLKYYEKFISKFPTISLLANAKDETVFKMWEGLGYYSRCKNLLETARIINKNGAVFPSTHKELLKLKGVGEYTAAAIASFAYNLPFAVVDGNVYRILSRYLANSTPTGNAAGKKEFAVIAQKFLHKKKPGLYNQAIMDLGATICKPVNPLCPVCPVQKNCAAKRTNSVSAYPVKGKKLIPKKRQFLYFIFQNNHSVFVTKRTGKGIWENLFEFPVVEVSPAKPIRKPQIKKALYALIGATHYNIDFISKTYSQKLSHQHIRAIFAGITVSGPVDRASFIWVNKKEFEKLAFPAIINEFVQAEKMRFNFHK